MLSYLILFVNGETVTVQVYVKLRVDRSDEHYHCSKKLIFRNNGYVSDKETLAGFSRL